MDFIFYISQGSVPTQLSSGGSVTTLLQIFHRMRQWKKNLKIGQHLAKIWTKGCGFLFGATLYVSQNCLKSGLWNTVAPSRC